MSKKIDFENISFGKENSTGLPIDFTEYGKRLDGLAKQIKETSNQYTEGKNEKETKKQLHNFVVDIYQILIGKLGANILSFQTWMEVKVLDNNLKTKRMLDTLKDEILATHLAKEKLQTMNIEKPLNKEVDTTKTKKYNQPQKDIKTYSEYDTDNLQLLQMTEKNRDIAEQRVDNYITLIAQKNPFTSGLTRLQKKAN